MGYFSFTGEQEWCALTTNFKGLISIKQVISISKLRPSVVAVSMSEYLHPSFSRYISVVFLCIILRALLHVAAWTRNHLKRTGQETASMRKDLNEPITLHKYCNVSAHKTLAV